ncbi:MAG: hypothetical protein K8U03_15860 [Planctomycetia bacterium]|nr:hypothetical protein [Planctomycetia bacterium]
MSTIDPPADERPFPPELLIAPPRTIVKGWRVRLASWLFLTLVFLLPGALSFMGYLSQATFQRLLDHGAKTTGKVVEKWPPRDKSSPSLVYEYVVSGESHRVSEPRSREDWAATALGTEAPIVYLPEDPGSAYTEHAIVVAGKTSTTALALWIISGVLAVCTLPFWIYIGRRHGKIAQLARSGIPTNCTITSVERISISNHDHWTLKYSFSTPGKGAREGKSYVTGAEAGLAGGEGAQTALLYDPANEGNYELYVVVGRQYRIVVDDFAVVRTSGGFRSHALLAALLVVAVGTRPQTTCAQAPAAAPTAIAKPTSTTPQISEETMRRMQRQLQRMEMGMSPDPLFQPETGDGIARKLETGEYRIDVDRTPWYSDIYWLTRIGFTIFAFVMFIISLVRYFAAKNPQQVQVAQAEVSRANQIAKQAGAKYQSLVHQADHKHFAEQRDALAAAGTETEALFRQAAERYRAASEQFAQAGDPENPSAYEKARVRARAYKALAESQSTMADIAGLLRDTTVTSAEDFISRAKPLLAAAKASGDTCRNLLAQVGDAKGTA